jgi:hypothetical protein
MPTWEFGFWNFDLETQWFGVYHAGCGGAPWHEGRPNCWGQYIPNNLPSGGYSVYEPSPWVVDFGAWLDVILEGLQTAINVAIFVASDGEDMKALSKAFSDAFKVGSDVIQAEIEERKLNAENLQRLLKENFASACSAIGQSQEYVFGVAQNLGFEPSGWGIITASDYQNRINNNSTINGGSGWTILRSGPDATDHVDYIANHAFIQDGHLIYVWDSRNLSGFWNPYSLTQAVV